MIECLEQLYGESISLCNTIDKLVRENDLQDTQDFLNWQDKLNEISVK